MRLSVCLFEMFSLVLVLLAVGVYTQTSVEIDAQGGVKPTGKYAFNLTTTTKDDIGVHCMVNGDHVPCRPAQFGDKSTDDSKTGVGPYKPLMTHVREVVLAQPLDACMSPVKPQLIYHGKVILSIASCACLPVVCVVVIVLLLLALFIIVVVFTV